MNYYTGQCRHNDNMSVTQSLANRQRPDKSPRKIIIVQKCRTIMTRAGGVNDDDIPDWLKLLRWEQQGGQRNG